MSDTITQRETATDFLRLTARRQVDDAFAVQARAVAEEGRMEPGTVPMANRDGMF